MSSDLCRLAPPALFFPPPDLLNSHKDSLKLIMMDEHISCDKAPFRVRR